MIHLTTLAIDEVIEPTIGKITIKYNIPLKLSLANISIFQVNNNGPDLLR